MRRATLLLAFENELDVQRKDMAGLKEGFEGTNVHLNTRLVVLGSPADQPIGTYERFERRRLPKIDRVGRLDVVVPVGDYGGGPAGV